VTGIILLEPSRNLLRSKKRGYPARQRPRAEFFSRRNGDAPPAARRRLTGPYLKPGPYYVSTDALADSRFATTRATAPENAARYRAVPRSKTALFSPAFFVSSFFFFFFSQRGFEFEFEARTRSALGRRVLFHRARRLCNSLALSRRVVHRLLLSVTSTRAIQRARVWCIKKKKRERRRGLFPGLGSFIFLFFFFFFFYERANE